MAERLRHPGRVWALAVVLALLVLAGIESYWRGQGFQAEISDSKQLWSLQRDRVYGDDPLPVVFIGASRTAYGIDLASWRTRYPDTRPVMLSVNGHHPLAALEDLARDARFHGLVICDVNSEGLLTRYRDMQQPWVDFYHQRWTPNWRVHRLMLNVWQRLSVLGNPDLGWKPAMQRWIAGTDIDLPVAEIDDERSGRARFERMTNLAGYGQWFENAAEGKMRDPLPAAEDFIRELADVVEWVHAIQARGGQVVFFQPPVGGKLLDLEFRYFDRDRYWDEFAALPGIHAVQGMDIPALRRLELPDRSHVTAAGRTTMTLELADEIQRLGLITPSGEVVAEERVQASPRQDDTWPRFDLPRDVSEASRQP